MPRSRPVEFFTETDDDFVEAAGVMAMRVRILWAPIPLNATCRRLLEKLKESCGDQKAFNIPLLSENQGDYGIWCHVHGHINGSRITQMQTLLSRKPMKRKPPIALQKSSKEFGGFPEGFERLFEEINDKNRVCHAWVEFMPLANAALKIRKRSAGSNIVPFRIEAERITLRGRGASVAIELMDNFQSVEVESKLSLRIRPDCFNIACNLLSKKIRPILNVK